MEMYGLLVLIVLNFVGIGIACVRIYHQSESDDFQELISQELLGLFLSHLVHTYLCKLLYMRH